MGIVFLLLLQIPGIAAASSDVCDNVISVACLALIAEILGSLTVLHSFEIIRLLVGMYSLPIAIQCGRFSRYVTGLSIAVL